MLPLFKGCRALIINDPDNEGEVVVGERHGRCILLEDGLTGIISHSSPIWEVDRDLVIWHVKTKEKTYHPYCPEHRLMRIDGFENKKVRKAKIVERVLA